MSRLAHPRRARRGWAKILAARGHPAPPAPPPPLRPAPLRRRRAGRGPRAGAAPPAAAGGGAVTRSALSALARALWVLPLAGAAWRFHPITRNYFFGDDLFNFYEVVNRGVIEYLVKPYGLHLLAARNLVFYGGYQLFGMHAEPYFWLVLATHLLNVLLVYDILRRFTGSRAVACLGATLWGMSPANDGALEWFSVYGQVLAATLTLWVLRRLAQVAGGAPASAAAALRWSALLLVAAMSFGTGIGMVMVFPLVAWILLPPAPARRRTVTAFAAAALLLPFLYVGLHKLAELYAAPAAGALGFAFSGLGRQTTVALGTLHMLVYGLATLVLGPFRDPVPYPDPLVVTIGAAALLAIGAALAVSDAPRRRQLLAALALGLTCYAIIVAGRVGFFARMGGKVVTAGRYHYAATAMLTLALVPALAVLARRLPGALPRAWAGPAWAAALALLVLPYAVVPHPLAHHDRERALAAEAVAEIEARVDAAPPGSDVLVENRPYAGVGPFMVQRGDLFPGLAAIFAIYYPDPVVDGRRVFFVLDDGRALDAARRGRKTGRFVLAPGETPG